MLRAPHALIAALAATSCMTQSGGLATGESLRLAGERPQAAFGSSGDLGYFNGDGFADVAVGAPGDSLQETNAGTVYLFDGSATGLIATHAARLLGRLNDRFGMSVANLGPISGTTDALAVASRTAIYIFLNPTGLRFSETADFIIDDNASGTNSNGLRVSSAGDIDQNGALDLAISNPAANRVYLFLNGGVFPHATRLLTSQADVTILGDSEFGSAIAFAGDVNAQNLGLQSRFGDDFIIGSPGSLSGKGTAYLVLGRQGFPRGHVAISAIVSRTYVGNASGDRFGTSVAGLGDFDADGFGDVAVGAPGNLSGYVNVYFGESIAGPSAQTPMVISGEGGGDGFGSSVAGALLGAVNGVYPLFAGSPLSDFTGPGTGSAYGLTKALFASGSSLKGVTGSASFADYVFRSPFAGYGPQGAFGTWTKAGPDVNGDGSGDLLIGAPGANAAGVQSGAALVLW